MGILKERLKKLAIFTLAFSMAFTSPIAVFAEEAVRETTFVGEPQNNQVLNPDTLYEFEFGYSATYFNMYINGENEPFASCETYYNSRVGTKCVTIELPSKFNDKTVAKWTLKSFANDGAYYSTESFYLEPTYFEGIVSIKASCDVANIDMAKGLDRNAIKVVGTYASGEEKDVTKDCMILDPDAQEGSDKINSAKPGEKEIIIAYVGEDAMSELTTDLKLWFYGNDKISASYKNEKMGVGSEIKSEDVEVTLYKTALVDGTTPSEKVSVDNFKLDKTKVENVGENIFTVTAYGLTDNFVVEGIETAITEIEAKYTGSDILVGKEFDKKNVEVTVKYNTGESEKVTDFTVNSTKVLDEGNNEFEATVLNNKAKFNVWGVKIDKLEAKYEDEKVFVGEELDIKKVTLTATYTKGSDGKAKSEKITNFNLDSKKVEKEGKNRFKAFYEGGEAEFEVIGKTKEKNVFKISVVDKDGKEIKDVKVEYKLDGETKSLRSGDKDSVEIDHDKEIKEDDCTVALPDGYKLYSKKLESEKKDNHTVYELKVVLEKEKEVVKEKAEKEEVKKAVNNNDHPQTDDSSMPLLYICLMIALIGASVMVVKIKRK